MNQLGLSAPAPFSFWISWQHSFIRSVTPLSSQTGPSFRRYDSLASGVTPDNVGDYLPYVDAYLVATGIEEEFGVLDPARTKALADKVHGWGG